MKYLSIGASVIAALLSVYIYVLRGDLELLELEAEASREKLALALAANKANDAALAKIIVGYEAQVSDFAAALKAESEAHNETRKLIAVLEGRGMDSRLPPRYLRSFGASGGGKPPIASRGNDGERGNDGSENRATPIKTECVIGESDPILEALNAQNDN